MSRKHPLRLILLYCALAVLSLLFRETSTAQKSEEPIVLEHADSLHGTVIDGEQARILIGDVRFRQGKTVVTCQRALHFLTSNRVSLEGVVEVRDDSMRLVGNRGVYDANERVAEAFDRVMLEDPTTTLHARYGKYFANEKRAYFRDHVRVVDTTSSLTADELTYYRDEDRTVAIGNVRIENPANNMIILGNRFENLKPQSYSKMTEKPMVIQIDTAEGRRDTLTVTAVTLESFQDTLERLVATDSVRMIRSGMAAEAGLSTYYTELDSIVLLQSPFVWYTAGEHDDNQVSGDSIFIKLHRRQLRTVYVRGRAVAISRADSLHPNRFNQMTGQEIILHFDESKLQRIDVDVTATSLYYLFDEGRPNGVNKISGDHVTITFADGRIDKIKVIAGVEGQYIPERLVKGRESEYNLQGFNWRNDRPLVGQTVGRSE